MRTQKFPVYCQLIFLLCSPFPLIFGQTSIPQEGLKAIVAEDMLAHVRFLASDAMRGRNTPSPELDSCAVYIASYFKACGLQVAATADGYYQNFPLLKTRLGGEQRLVVNFNGTEKVYQIKDDFIPLHLTANRTVTAPVVFAGYGITAPEFDYDDYDSIDVKGKFVLIFTNEPQENDNSSVFDGKKLTDHSKLDHKVLNAIDHGAVGFIYVTNPMHRFRRPPNIWPSLMKTAPTDAIPFTLGEREENKIVVGRIGKELADDLMAGSGKSMAALHAAIDANLQPQSFMLPNVTATLTTDLASSKTMTRNVVGFWPGADLELKNEIVVVGGHYDHVGAVRDSIYHGADDNASGTAGVMALARAFTACEQRPRRSILFICFAGEETGLFGSRYYTGTEPLFPLEHTVAMFNLDMIGRNDSNQVDIYGSVRSPGLKDLLLTANESINLEFDFKNDRTVNGSDHVSFFRKDIPFLFFFTGLHDDYHQPSDTVEKILPDKMAKIARLVFGCAWQVANMTGRPELVTIDNADD